MGLTPVQGQPSACPETVWSGQLCIHFVCVLLGGFVYFGFFTSLFLLTC